MLLYVNYTRTGIKIYSLNIKNAGAKAQVGVSFNSSELKYK